MPMNFLMALNLITVYLFDNKIYFSLKPFEMIPA